jgi:hypothetical protein
MSGENKPLIAQLTDFQRRRNALATATTPTTKTEQLGALLKLNADMAAAVRVATTESDTQGLLGELGTLRQQLTRLKEQREEAQEAADTAAARKASVEKREEAVSYHQLFMVNRPLKEYSIPTLMTISVLLVVLGMRWLYLVYYGVGSGPVSFSLLTGMGTALGGIGQSLQNTRGSTGLAAQPALKVPGQGITSQLGL